MIPTIAEHIDYLTEWLIDCHCDQDYETAHKLEAQLKILHAQLDPNAPYEGPPELI